MRDQVEIPGVLGQGDAQILVVFDPETPDRTAAIRGTGPSPLPHLQASAQVLAEMGASRFGVPCNTAHYFLHAAMADSGWAPPVPLIDMIDLAAGQAARLGVGTVGVLATTGTISSGLYQRAVHRAGLRALVPPDAIGPSPSRPGSPASERARLVEDLVSTRGEQDGLVMEAIYGPGGIKAGHTDGLPFQLLEEAAGRLVDRGAGALILGCTEIPLVLKGAHMVANGQQVPLIDATAALASGLLPGDGPIGIAGGLGPEATIDLVEKLRAAPAFIDLLRAIFSATVEQLGAARDQDHLRMFAAQLPDAIDGAQRLKRAGATFLLVGPGFEALAGDVQRVTGLPTIVGPPREVGRLVVRAACPRIQGQAARS